MKRRRTQHVKIADDDGEDDLDDLAQKDEDKIIELMSFSILDQRAAEEEMRIENKILRLIRMYQQSFWRKYAPRHFNLNNICDELCHNNQWLVKIVDQDLPVNEFPRDRRTREPRNLSLWGCIMHGTVHRCGIRHQCFSCIVTTSIGAVCLYSGRSAFSPPLGMDAGHDDYVRDQEYYCCLRPATVSNLWLQATQEYRAQLGADRVQEHSIERFLPEEMRSTYTVRIGGPSRRGGGAHGPRQKSVPGQRKILESIYTLLISNVAARKKCIDRLVQDKLAEVDKEFARYFEELGLAKLPGEYGKARPDAMMMTMPSMLPMMLCYLGPMEYLQRFDPTFDPRSAEPVTFGQPITHEEVDKAFMLNFADRMEQLWEQYCCTDAANVSENTLRDLTVYVILELGKGDLMFYDKVVLETNDYWKQHFPTPDWASQLDLWKEASGGKISVTSYKAGLHTFNNCERSLRDNPLDEMPNVSEDIQMRKLEKQEMQACERERQEIERQERDTSNRVDDYGTYE